MTTLDDLRRKAEAEARGEAVFMPEALTLDDLRKRGEAEARRAQDEATGNNRARRRRSGYYLFDGREFPSVTTILNVLAKPALIYWLQRETAKAVIDGATSPEQAIRAVKEASKVRAQEGSDAHTAAEAYTRGEMLTDNPYFASIDNFFKTIQPKALHTELVLLNTEHGYAGTCDFIAKVGASTVLIDFKTSKAVYKDYHLQVAAYRRCELGITRTGERLKIIPADKTAIVLLRTDGSFQYIEVVGDYDVFLAALQIFNWVDDDRA